MKIYTSLFISFLFVVSAKAQSGCTDLQASNYSASATSNDGSCLYPVTYQPFSLKVNTINVSENSGIEWINGGLYTFGDSGNPANLYKIDTSSGSIVQTIHVSNYPNNDWEDITADSAYVYLNDAGNNDGIRTDLRILKIKKSDFIGNTSSLVTLTAQAINFSYADQTSYASNSNNNFDCESLINIGDSLYIFTKDRGDLKTRVYRLPKTPGTYTISPYTTYNVNGKLTGADYNPISKEVVLIGYLSGDENSFIWYLSDFQGTNFFSGNKRRIELGNSNYAWQTEGICFYNEQSTTRIFISCEKNGKDAGVYVSDVRDLSNGIKEQKNNQAAIRYMPDNSITVLCNSDIKTAGIYDILGQQTNMYDITFTESNMLSIKKKSDMPLSVSLLKIETNSGEVYVNKIIK